MQDACSELVVKESSYSKLEDIDCDSSDSLSDCSVCFAVPVTNRLSSLVMEEVSQNPQYLEPPDTVHLVTSSQLQRTIMKKKSGQAASLGLPNMAIYLLLRCCMKGLLHNPWLQDLQWNQILVYLQ